MKDTVEIELTKKEPVRDKDSKKYDFTLWKESGNECLNLRNPILENYEMVKKEGLKLYFTEKTLVEETNPTFLAIRQCHHNFLYKATFSLEDALLNKKVGIVYMQNNFYHMKLQMGETGVEMIQCLEGKEEILKIKALKDKNFTFILKVNGYEAQFLVEIDEMIHEIGTMCSKSLTTEVAGGFVGCTIGVYAIGSDENRDSVFVKKIEYNKL